MDNDIKAIKLKHIIFSETNILTHKIKCYET